MLTLGVRPGVGSSFLILMPIAAVSELGKGILPFQHLHRRTAEHSASWLVGRWQWHSPQMLVSAHSLGMVYIGPVCGFEVLHPF